MKKEGSCFLGGREASFLVSLSLSLLQVFPTVCVERIEVDNASLDIVSYPEPPHFPARETIQKLDLANELETNLIYALHLVVHTTLNQIIATATAPHGARLTPQ